MTTETNFRPDSEYSIGTIYSVDSKGVKISIPFEQECNTVEMIGVNSYIMIDCNTYAVLGQISEISYKQNFITATASLFASINYSNGVITSGVLEFPKLSANVYNTPPEIIQRITTRNYQDGTDVAPVQLELGYLPNPEKTPLSFTPNSLFGRHLAVVGTTGAGKSWCIARIMDEIARYNSKVILFDASGEFLDMPSKTVHVTVGLDPNPPKYVYPVSVPYFELRENDLFAIFKPSGRSQFPKLKEAMKSLKLARLAPHLAIDGVILKAHRSKIDYENEYLQYSKELESPTANFNINALTSQIENECVFPQRSPTENDVWGGLNGEDFSDCVPLINRIHDIIVSPNLSPIFNPKRKHSLFTVIKHFLTDPEQRILRISLQYLSFDYNAREIVANAIGRHLLEIARTGFLKQQPLLVVVDEAHQFLNRSVVLGEGNEFPLNAFSLIAKEGRKYAINICLATQRPRDIPEGILSQMGTLIVHRLINAKDRELIEKASATMDANTADSIPVLPSGRAVIVGVDFPIPLTINIAEPTGKPNSNSADYQRYWKIEDENKTKVSADSDKN